MCTELHPYVALRTRSFYLRRLVNFLYVLQHGAHGPVDRWHQQQLLTDQLDALPDGKRRSVSFKKGYNCVLFWFAFDEKKAISM